MEYIIAIACSYLFIGLGFSLSAWLQAAEIQVNENRDFDKFISGKLVLFILMWPFLAAYCYRADVKKTIKKVDWSKVK